MRFGASSAPRRTGVKRFGSIHSFAMKTLLPGRREQWGEHPIAMALQGAKVSLFIRKRETKTKEQTL